MGWTLLTSDELSLITKYNYIVCVFSHTSFYDFLLMILYYFAHPELAHLKTLISPHYYYNIFNYIGGIKAPSIHTKNGNQLNTIVNQLLKTPKSHLLISPKGSILKREWRTGYYYIAQSLKCPLVCLGMDYEQKKVFVGDTISYKHSEPHIRQHLYKDLSKIVPLYPEREVVPIRPYNNYNVSLISFNRIVIFYLCLLSFIQS